MKKSRWSSFPRYFSALFQDGKVGRDNLMRTIPLSGEVMVPSNVKDLRHRLRLTLKEILEQFVEKRLGVKDFLVETL